MELQKNQSILSVSKSNTENYNGEIGKEILHVEGEFRSQVTKVFNSSDLWNIQRQRRFTNHRRYI